jgi:tetratricopeptide (TPR) repeat protein
MAYAWPTTLVFDSQGNLVGRIAGHPLNHRASLAAYVAYVSGTLTRTELDEELTRQQIVQDDANQKAHRHLLLARQFLTSGRTDDAAAQVREAQQLHPSTPALRLLMARELLILGETTQAEALLGTLDAATQPDELAILKARCAIALGRWPEAKDYLQKTRPAAPDPATAAEMLYWLGMIYTHDADYPQAAEAFRKAYEATLAR